MTESYSDSNLDIDPHRWYYTKFSIERYRQEVDWETVKEGFERTAKAVRILLNAYQSAGVFGDEELNAIKSTIQVSSVIGVEATQERIQNAAGKQSELDSAMELVAERTGIVGGIPYPVSANETSAETLLRIFDILTDDDAELSEVDSAAERFLGEIKYSDRPQTFTQGLEELMKYIEFAQRDGFLSDQEVDVRGLIITDGVKTKVDSPLDGNITHITADNLSLQDIPDTWIPNRLRGGE